MYLSYNKTVVILYDCMTIEVLAVVHGACSMVKTVRLAFSETAIIVSHYCTHCVPTFQLQVSH